MNGLEEVSTGDELYGGDLVALAKIMVGVIHLTESNSRMNFSDANRINEVSMRLNDDSVIDNGGGDGDGGGSGNSGYDHYDNDDETANGDDEDDGDLVCGHDY